MQGWLGSSFHDGRRRRTTMKMKMKKDMLAFDLLPHALRLTQTV